MFEEVILKKFWLVSPSLLGISGEKKVALWWFLTIMYLQDIRGGNLPSIQKIGHAKGLTVPYCCQYLLTAMH